MGYEKYDKERRFRADRIEPTMKIGQARVEDTRRKCPVQGCENRPGSYSRYCKRHADRLRSNGHPTLDVRVQRTEDYERVLKIGRWVRKKLTKDDSDARAWEAVERDLVKLGTDPLLKHDVPTMVRREKSWRNGYKATWILQRRLCPELNAPLTTGACAEEVLAAYLGMAAVILKFNDVIVNRPQMMLFLNKAGARAVIRHMRFRGVEEARPEKVYKYNPKPGTVTAVGKVLNEKTSRQFGRSWWKGVEEAAVTLGR